MTPPAIYRYIVRHDAGTAPNPFDGWCSLAICKPRIRKAACVGDWVIGFRACNLGNVRTGYGHVLYAMQVEESLTFAEYWADKRFRSRRPSNKNPGPDNFYRPTRSPGKTEMFEWVENKVHDVDASKRDLSGQKVLIAQKFWYFGMQSADHDRRLPMDLLHLSPTTQGHVVRKHRKPDDVRMLEAWLKELPIGMSSEPTAPRRLTRLGQSGNGSCLRKAPSCGPRA